MFFKNICFLSLTSHKYFRILIFKNFIKRPSCTKIVVFFSRIFQIVGFYSRTIWTKFNAFIYSLLFFNKDCGVSRHFFKNVSELFGNLLSSSFLTKFVEFKDIFQRHPYKSYNIVSYFLANKSVKKSNKKSMFI